MKEAAKKLNGLIMAGTHAFSKMSERQAEQKTKPEKWSKKEILGHLIDSAINNLQRFTEIQFQPKPYRVKPYRQVELVKANLYQNTKTEELVGLWAAVNQRIIKVVEVMPDDVLDYVVLLNDDKKTDLRFLINDYVGHTEHHLRQITER